MCINYINEKVQQMFVKRMLKEEEEWYSRECLDLPKIQFLDNCCILGKIKKKNYRVKIQFFLNFFFSDLDVFDNNNRGIFRTLDDSIKMQNQSTKHFIENILSNWKNHSNVSRSKPSAFQNEEFIIRHFAGDVVYNVVSLFQQFFRFFHFGRKCVFHFYSFYVNS